MNDPGNRKGFGTSSGSTHRKSGVKNVKFGPKSPKERLKRIWALTKKEIKVITNDKFAMLLLFIIPITMICTIQFAGAGAGPIGGDSTSRNQVPLLGIIDEDDSRGFDGYDLSEEFVKILEDYESRGEVILYKNYNRSELEYLLGHGDINAYLIIENGFEFNLSTHFYGVFKIVIDKYNQMIYQDVESLIDEIVGVFEQKFNFTGAIEKEISLVNVPEKALRLFQISPLIFPLIIFSMTSLVNSQSIIGDIPKDRMVLTPANKRQILLGKLFGSILVNTTMVITLWGLSLLFGMSTRGSSITYLFILWSCSLVGTSIGLFISSFSQSNLAAFQLFVLFFLSQSVLILSISNKNVLSIFPIWLTGQLMFQVTLQGMPLLEPATGPLPYISIIYIEFFGFLLGAYIKYKKTRSLI